MDCKFKSAPTRPCAEFKVKAVTLSFLNSLGVFLRLTDRGGVLENRAVNAVTGAIVNAVRSTPFIILLVAIIPFTRFIVGSSIGTAAAIVPLT